MTAPGRIDVHHHLIPPAFVQAMRDAGISMVAGAPLPAWTPEASIRVMDDNGIAVALTSLSAPGVYFGDIDKACRLARECNEYAREIGERHRGRFGSFAVLPMPSPEHACREAVYALDTLGADGIVLLGSTEGRFLGDPSFEELMAELDRRSAVVFVHPNLHASSVAISGDLDTPGWLLEFLCDTTRAATNLILKGVLERYPRIRWILAHAGGFLPYVAWRLSLSNLLPQYRDVAPQGFLTYARRFWYDTALSPSPYALAALRELVEPSHILFGSDYPFAPAPVTALQTKQLAELRQLDAATTAGVDRAHALALFPRLAGHGEAALPAPAYRSEDLAGRLRRLATRPLLRLADRARNR